MKPGPGSGETADVLLISMPFGLAHRPSIGLGLLHAALARHGVAARVLYLNLRFAARVGGTIYTKIATGDHNIQRFLGEWIFAHQLFADLPSEAEYLRHLEQSEVGGRGVEVTDDDRRKILEMRAEAGPFLDQCVDEIGRWQPRFVGLTSTMQQHVSSLALARRLKARYPDVFIAMGGANCEGVMGGETLRRFPWLDAVVSGEADRIVHDLVDRVLSGRPVAGIAGVFVAAELAGRFAGRGFENAPRVDDLDALPYPDYDDYFAQFAALQPALGELQPPDVYFETSRGCWWGAKSHCTFCGLNGAGMAFRSKSADRALAELDYLSEKYPEAMIYVVDNILDMSYFKDFIPALAERRSDLHLFYETKANLTKAQLRLMHGAGIRSIQPGVESFSDEVLKLMRKGVTALQNVQLLKWCREVGVHPYWNLIWGFPGEPAAGYRRMARRLPLLSHLPPPCGFGPIRLDRFSPNFDHAEELGFRNVRPSPAYRYVYSLPEEARYNLAYYFDFDYREPRDVESYVQPVLDELLRWQKVHDESALFSRDQDGTLQIWDLRPATGDRRHALTGLARGLYLCCDRIRSLEQLQRFAGGETGRQVAAGEIEELLAPLVDGGLLLREGPLFLSLAVPLGTYLPGPKVMLRFFELAVAPSLSPVHAD